MDELRGIYTQLIQFGHDVTTAYNNLSLGSRVVIGGAVGCYLLKRYAGSISMSLLVLSGKVQDTSAKKPDFTDGVVYLHIFPRWMGKKVPNLSPFVMKVETWLRLHNVKHEIVETMQPSKSTSQMPYIIYNGKEYADSELIMDFLQKELNIKEDCQLSPAEMGIQRAFISMLDEKTSFIYALYRYYYAGEEFLRFCRFSALPKFIVKYMAKTILKDFMMQKAAAQGIGRKSRDVMISIGNKDLKALSLYLKDKKFLAGDEITRADCCAFAHLSQMLYVDLPYPFTDFMRRECQNLEPYINRIKAELYPDWNSIVDDSEFQ